jgi:uncharacterized protein YqgV (UPF0045/DUF77 family)
MQWQHSVALSDSMNSVVMDIADVVMALNIQYRSNGFETVILL